jgi:YVTN family beta-propeller protein
MLMMPAVLVLTATLAGCSPSAPQGRPQLPLRQVQDVPLPGGATRLDYQAIDPAAKRLYVTHLGDGTVHVLDLDRPTVLRTIEGIGSVHGITLAAGTHAVLASASGTDEVVVIDTGSLDITARIPTGHTPDGIAYDPVHGKAYVSNEHDNVETVVDLAAGRSAGSVDIGGEAGNSILDPESGRIMVNVQTRGELVAIDPATDRITDRIHLEGCTSNHGLYVDGAKHLAFVACEGNARLLVVDLDSRQMTGGFDVGSGPDVLAFDQGLHRLYVAAESGVVTVLDEDGKGLRQIGQAKLADGAHTVAVDQSTHRVYFPLENVNGKPVLRVMEPVQ